MAFVQSNQGVTSFATSVAAVFGSNNTSGNYLTAVVGNDGSVVPTIADSRNTWQALAVGIDNAGVRVTIFYAMNCGAGANTVTASFGATNCAASIAIMEWSNVELTSALDKTATGTGFGTAATTAATATTTWTDELLVLGTCREATASPFTFTAGGSFTETQDTGGLCPRPIQMAYQVVSVAGAYSGAATLQGGSENWAQAIATFRLQGGSIPPVFGGSAADDRYRFRPSQFWSGTSTLGTKRSTWPDDARDFGRLDALADHRTRVN